MCCSGSAEGEEWDGENRDLPDLFEQVLLELGRPRTFFGCSKGGWLHLVAGESAER